jgi:4-hydroxy-2-oxoheptanedioate aldolase
MFRNSTKAKIKNGEAVLGALFGSNSADIAEVLGAAGLDFILIDCEHGPGSPESVINCIRAAESRGASPIVRITEDTRTGILRYLDIGAQGILAPQIESAKQTEQVIRHAKYSPEGIRGMAMPRASTWGMDGAEYARIANAETLIAVQCENTACLNDIEKVAQVPGLDVIFLGPYDMSHALGIPGQLKHPLMLDAEKRILSAAQKAGIAAGTFVGTVENAIKAREEGWKFILLGTDIMTLGAVYKNYVEAFRSGLK